MYILVIISLVSGGYQFTTQEFLSKEKCARVAYALNVNPTLVHAACVPK
jgi:hypothetical protein